MAIFVTLFLNYGGLMAVKRCSNTLTFSSLMGFACSKWPALRAYNIQLTYMLEGCREIVLTDDEDMGSMFGLMSEMSVDRMDVYVKENKGHDVAPSQHIPSQLLLPMIEYQSVVEEPVDEAIAELTPGKKLMSADWIYLIKDEGQVFEGGVKEFRKALVKFSIEMGFDYIYVKNESNRVTAECKYKYDMQCQWRIHASTDKYSKFCYIRKYNKHHTCGMFFGTADKKRLTSAVIMDLIADDVRAMPSITPREVMAQVKKNFGVDISYYIAWRSTAAGRASIFGDHSSSYAWIPTYFKVAERANPGSVFDLEVDGTARHFVRCFFAFAACLQGFKYCRPVMMVDGTFLKGKHKGCLLSAVGKDGAEGIFPVAFAIVSEETNENWAWFLNRLKVAIGPHRVLSFVSDRNQGIIKGVQNIFPDCPHAYCYKHLKSNLKDRFSGVSKEYRKAIVRQFADCAYAATKPEFERCLEKFKSTGGVKVSNFLADLPREKWSNAYFEGRKYGQMTSNGSESWNGQISDERFLPVVNLMDGIRMKLMHQLCTRLGKGNSWNTVLTDPIEKKVKDLVDQARPWPAKKSSEFLWEVYSDPRAVVDLREKTCSCRKWQIYGLPCFHAAGIIFLKMNGDYSLIDEWYHNSTFKQSYDQGGIAPFVLPEIDPTLDVVGPPKYQPQRGRPKTKRIPSRGENMPRKMRCSGCNQLGNHNKKTCNMSGQQ